MATPRASLLQRTLPCEPAWLDRWLFPFESRYKDIDANHVHYIDEGEGPLLLFLHPSPAWSFIYRDLTRTLRSRYRCVEPLDASKGLGLVEEYERLRQITDAPAKVPVLATLARSFAVCTRWFASVPGETWPNRNFLHSGTSDGTVDIEIGFSFLVYADNAGISAIHDDRWIVYRQPVLRPERGNIAQIEVASTNDRDGLTAAPPFVEYHAGFVFGPRRRHIRK